MRSEGAEVQTTISPVHRSSIARSTVARLQGADHEPMRDSTFSGFGPNLRQQKNPHHAPSRSWAVYSGTRDDDGDGDGDDNVDDDDDDLVSSSVSHSRGKRSCGTAGTFCRRYEAAGAILPMIDEGTVVTK